MMQVSHRLLRTGLTSSFIVIWLLAAVALAEDWPQWRGPNRDGTVVGFSIPDVWPVSLNKQWSVDVGDGY